MTIEIRDAEESHLPAILTIHNHAIDTTTANFSFHIVDIENRRTFLQERQRRGFPFLVAVENGTVLGFASFGDYRPQDGYFKTVEHSIYVGHEHHRRGVGALLMAPLIERARAIGKHVMVGAIDAANAASIGLHERFGFVRVGLMPEVGYKFDRYLDLVFMQKILD